MEQNWENRYTPEDRDNRYNRHPAPDRFQERNRYEDMPPQDPDTYRGAYRLDNSSDHRHVSTYYGFDGIEHPNERRGNFDDSSRHSRERDNPYGHSGPRHIYWQDNSEERYGNANEYRSAREDRPQPGWRDYMDHSDNWGGSNFNNDYGPDRYPHRRGENTGNMAGSLSFGYDGGGVSNPDYDRRYNPLTGEIRHLQQIRQRHHQGRNPSSYRWHDLNDDRRDY